MPNAVISGFTSEQAAGSVKVGYPALSPGIKVILESLGYDTINEPLRAETNLDLLKETDLLVMGISPMIAVGSRYLYGALDAIGKARATNTPMLWFISDWQVGLLTSAVRTILNGPHRLTKSFMRHRTDFLWAQHHEAELLRVVQAMNDNPWPATMIPAHPWRNDMPLISKNIPSRRLHYFDPTAVTSGLWAPADNRAPKNLRQREWVLAALGDYSEWVDQQQFSWPIRYFGGKTRTDAGEDGKKGFTQRVQESEIHTHYAETWGGLAPAHALTGCGWWRSRWDFILKNGGIIYGDDVEMRLMGPEFVNTVSEIESLNNDQLSQLAFAQRQAHQVEPLDSLQYTWSEAIKLAKEDIS
ncbi:hypothetical protein PP301_gp056 [Gordonia phage GMA2]|uniref:Uncharacterized protein n=1 Tax=Gordonia phage GMA2 TaxID=1647283 RepID=A0A0K0N6N0_9CAUD|nr:hypothetical protein PP301_gp056 [Gordonia phage GMA2]AKJ72594.1 hypothetical protein GMA2_56 [Gordonia phage GMA2]